MDENTDISAITQSMNLNSFEEILSADYVIDQLDAELIKSELDRLS